MSDIMAEKRCWLIYPSYFKLWGCWLRLLTPVTYLSKLLGISSLAAYPQLELFRVRRVTQGAIFLYITFTSFYIQKSSHTGSINLISIEKIKPDKHDRVTSQ